MLTTACWCARGATLVPLVPASLAPYDDADAARYYRQIGDALSAWGEDEAAFRHYREGLLRKTDDLRLHVHIARCLFRLGQPDLALDQVQRALKDKPEDPEGNRVLGGILLFTGHPDQAAETLEPLVARHGDDPLAHRLLGLSLLALGRESDARTALRTAVAKDPYDAEAWFRLAGLELAAKRRASGMALLERCLVADPNNVAALRALCDLNLGGQNFAAALPLALRVIELEPTDPQPLMVAGNLLLRLQQPERAATYFRRAYDSREPAVVLPAAQFLIDYSVGHAQYADVAQYAQRMLTLKPDLVPPRLALVQAYSVRGQWAAAAAAFEPLVRVTPKDPRARLQLLDLQLRARQFDAGVRTAQAVIATWPTEVPLAGQVIEGLVARNRLDLATSVLRWALDRYPRTPEYGYMLYSAYRRTGHRAEGRALLEQLLARYPDEALPRRELGVALLEQHEFERSAAMLGPLFAAGKLDVEGAKALGLACLRCGHDREALSVHQWVGHVTGEPLDQLAVGRDLERLGQTGEARALYREVLDERPGHLPTMLLLAAATGNTGDFKEAQRLFDRATALAPGVGPAWRGLALALQAQGRTEAARAAWQQYARRLPKDVAPVAALAELQPDTPAGLQACLDSYLRALDKLPESARLHARLGDAYLRRDPRDVDAALNQYAAAARLAASDWYPRWRAAELSAERGQPAGAARWWRELVDLLPTKEVCFGRWIDALAQSGPPELALDAGVQWLAPRRDDFAAASRLVAAAVSHGKLDALRGRVEQALVPNLDAPALRETYGLALQGLGRGADALAWYDRQAASGPLRARWLWRAGAVLETQGQWEQAWDRYRQAVRLAPTQRDYRRALAQAELATGRQTAGLATLRALLTEDPADLDAATDAVRAHHAAGRLPALVSELAKRAHEPELAENPNLQTALGLAYELSGQVGPAMAAYRAALAADPRLLAARQGLDRVYPRPAWWPDASRQPAAAPEPAKPRNPLPKRPGGGAFGLKQ